jgi:hypothetical protein
VGALESTEFYFSLFHFIQIIMFVDVVESLVLNFIIYCFTYNTAYKKGPWPKLF